MRRLFLLAVALSAAGSSTKVSAQDSGGCEIRSGPRTQINTYGAATYISGRTRFDCEGGTSFVADSGFSAYGRRLLIGSVVYSDNEKTVTSQRLDQEERTGTLISTGSTVVTDKKTGSILRAPMGLEYLRNKQTNEPGRLFVGGGRPHLTLYRTNANNTADTTDIDSDQMNLIGSNEFHGTGNVIIKRGTLNATAGKAEFADSAGRMLLWLKAQIKGEDYTLDADSIHGDLVEDVFKELRAFRDAHLKSKDLDVESARLRMMFDSGTVQRLVAVGASRDARAAAGPKQPGAANQGEAASRPPAAAKQATSVSVDFKLIADSIDALAPAQKLREVHAVGDAYAERTPDSLDTALPDLIKRDWLRGDTVRAFFVEAPDSIKARRAQTDSTGFDRVLERMIALGGAQPATAIFRVREQNDTTKKVQVNYIAARKITTFFKEGSLYDVNAEGEIKGIYLQPINVTTTPPPTRRNQ
jgi:hypothetical protein